MQYVLCKAHIYLFIINKLIYSISVPVQPSLRSRLVVCAVRLLPSLSLASGRGRGRLTGPCTPELWQRSYGRAHGLKLEGVLSGQLLNLSSSSGFHPQHPGMGKPHFCLVLGRRHDIPSGNARGSQSACQKTPPAAPTMWAMQEGGWLGFTTILQARE